MSRSVLKRSCVYGAMMPWLLLMVFTSVAPAENREARTTPPLTAAERAYLARKGAVTYCLDPDRLPFSAVTDGRPHGMAADVVARLEKRLGIPFRFIRTSDWRRALAYAESGRCDILPMIDLPPPARHPHLTTTTPYFQYSVAIITRSRVPFISGIRDLRDRTIGLVENDPIGESVARTLPDVPFTLVDHPRDGLLKVSGGSLDALVIAMPVAVYHVRQLGLSHLKVAGHTDILQKMGIGVRQELTLLRTILNKAVGAMAQPEIDRIYEQQIAVSPEHRVDYRLLIQIGLGTAILGGLLFFWRRHVTRLKKRVETAQAALAAKDEEMKRMAITDPLTCLNNRMRLVDILNKEMQRFQRYNRPVSIILADVDNFKEINKEFGYNLGDVVLCKIGQALADNVRKADICGRWGGEKFMIICPETRTDGAQTLAEHLRETIASIQLPKVGPRTCSFGVSSFIPEDNEETLVQRADKAQNAAKDAGGNRVVAPA